MIPAVLTHWHAVLPAARLGKQPVGVRIDDTEWVLFRAGHRVAAVANRCPHRGARLSRGRVVDGELVCASHGWRCRADGTVTPFTEPGRTPTTTRLDAVEQQGMVWVRAPGGGAPPLLDVDGFRHLTTFRVEVRAPVEVLVDSFSEIEHTGFVHVLGFDPARWSEVAFALDVSDHHVEVRCSGPQKRPVRAVTRLAGVPRGARYHVDWVTRFSPLHARYEHYWRDPATGRVHPERARAFAFFQPTGPATSAAVVSSWTTSARWGRLGLNRLLHPLHAALVRWEFARDKDLLDTMPDGAADLRDMALGPGDHAVTATRARVNRLYRRRA